MTAALSAPSGASTSNVAPIGSNALAILSTRLAKMDLLEMARALGKEDTTSACKVRSGDRAVTVYEFAKLVTACGLKLVPKEKICVDPRAYESLAYLAQKAVRDEGICRTLTWDEEQGS